MFQTPLRLEASPVEGNWILLVDLIWERMVEKRLERYVVPAGFVTDLASLPAFSRAFLRQNGKSRRAAVLHDFVWRQAKTLAARGVADRLFLAALAAEGVITAGRWTYFAGVRVGSFFRTIMEKIT